MKKILILAFIITTLTATAQNKSSVETRALMHSVRNSKAADITSTPIAQRLPIRNDGNSLCIGVLAKVDNTFDAKKLSSYGIRQSSRVADIVSLRVPLDALHNLETFPGIVYFSVAHKVAPEMDKTRFDTRTDSIHEGLGTPMPFDGEGVLIGITDWGFDYTHPNINKKSAPRILRAWDQFKRSGPAPAGFDYGTEYSTDDDIRAAKGDTSGIYGYATHGTHVAGICGGNGTSQGKAIGQAPKAQFLLGSWFLDEASWLDQVAWMKSVAQNEGKRLVINSSWGMYSFSTIDGTSLLSQAINSYSDSGIVFVTSAGNNGDVRYHLQHSFSANDTLASLASYYSSGIGQALIYWGEPPSSGLPSNHFRAGFALVDKNDPSQIVYSPMYYSANDNDYVEGFVVAGTDTVRYDLYVESCNFLDNRPHIQLNVDKTNNYNLMMLCVGDEGSIVNIWNMTNLANGAGNMGCDFSKGNVDRCVIGDYKYGIGEPACAEKTITVAAHTADFLFRDTILTLGDIATFSSYGPTLDGRKKPEISAPGVGVISSISTWNTDNYEAVYETVSGGRHYKWSAMSGTSMSSPAVTGIVALMLQANPHISVDQIRDIIFSTARNDEKTGPLIANDSMSIRWGHGKINALRAVNEAYDAYLAVEDAPVVLPKLVTFPNPTSTSVTILTGSNIAETIELFAVDGRKVMQLSVAGQASIDLSSLPAGVYFARSKGVAGVRTAKIVKQ